MARSKRWSRSVFALAAFAFAANPAAAHDQAWIRHVGSSAHDGAYAIAPDRVGGMFVGGAGDVGGPSAGFSDAWLARYDGAGQLLWLRQFGTSTDDFLYAMEPDGMGGVFVAGITLGNLGAPNAGLQDVWLARFDGAGNQIWLRQFGTSALDWLNAVAKDDAGGIYVAGYTRGNLGGPSAGYSDAWLARYDSQGNQVWIRQFGSKSFDLVHAAATDSVGGVYLTGYAYDYLPSGVYGAWLARYDGAGNELWIRVVGTHPDNRIYAAAPDGAGGVYVGGKTAESLGNSYGGGFSDAWLARYDSVGNRTWLRLLGTKKEEVTFGIASDGTGGVYAGGYTTGDLLGASAGLWDAWLARYDGNGNRVWIDQFGSQQDDSLQAVAPDGQGGAFVCGETRGDLGGTNAGGFDGWFARYEAGRVPPTVYCTGKTNSLGCVPVIGQSGFPSSKLSSGFIVEATNVYNQKQGMLLYSLAGPNAAPFQGGLLCLASPIQRSPARSSGGGPAVNKNCSGVWRIDMNAFAAGQIGGNPNPALKNPGTIVHCQWWGRDPGDPHGSALSDALQYQVSFE